MTPPQDNLDKNNTYKSGIKSIQIVPLFAIHFYLHSNAI